MAILNRFSAILVSCDSTHFLLLAVEFLAIPGPRLWDRACDSIRDSVPLRSRELGNPDMQKTAQKTQKMRITDQNWKNWMSCFCLFPLGLLFP